MFFFLFWLAHNLAVGSERREAGRFHRKEALEALKGKGSPAVHAVAEEDAGRKLGDDRADARLGQRQRRVLAAGSAARSAAAPKFSDATTMTSVQVRAKGMSPPQAGGVG